MDPVKYIKKEYLLDQMSQFVSSKSIIKETYFKTNQILKCPAAISRTEDWLGFGADIDFSTAMLKSMAEALERYTLTHDKGNGVLLYKKTRKELEALGHTCFYPDYNLYEDFVYKTFCYCRKLTPDIKTEWVSSTRFSDNQIVWIPASLMYVNTGKKPINLLKTPSSSGMACSFFHSAVEDSILELIERDTFMYMWLAKSPGEEIVFDSVSSQSLKELLSIIDCKMKQIRIVHKCTDTRIPCIFILFNGKKKYNEPAFLITGAADLDIERSCYRALLEFCYAYNDFFLQKPLHDNRIEKIKSKKHPDILVFYDRYVFYTVYENLYKCEFLFNTVGCRKISELSGKWKFRQKKEDLLRSALKDKTIFITDITPLEIAKSDIHIVRAYSPDLMDIDIGENNLFNSSFKRRRVDMIDKVFNRKTNHLNSDPHCYA